MPFPLILLGVAVAAVALAYAKRPKTKTKVKRSTIPDQGVIAGYPYFVEHINGAVIGDRSPAIIVAHGLGVTPQGITNLVRPLVGRPAHLIVPSGKNKFGANPAWWLARAADPDQDTLAAQMTWVANDIELFLHQVRAAYGPLTVVGHSQGAMLAALLAAKHPELIRNAVGASAWLPQALWTTHTAPLTVVHGTADGTIPFARTRAWVDQMAVNGAPITLVEVPGAGHGFGALGNDFQSALAQSI
jgi:predicted esterase